MHPDQIREHANVIYRQVMAHYNNWETSEDIVEIVRALLVAFLADEASERVAIARENGKKGGRPRKKLFQKYP